MLLWGTYGKNGITHCNGTCPEHQLQIVRLIDCSSEHLIAILDTQHHIPPIYREVITVILRDRRVPQTTDVRH